MLALTYYLPTHLPYLPYLPILCIMKLTDVHEENYSDHDFCPYFLS